MRIRSFRIMLIPNNKQLTKLKKYSDVARFAYNWALGKQIESFENGKGFISDKELRKEFTQLKKLPEYQWLNDVSCDVAKQAIKDLCNAYIRFMKKRKQQGYKPYSKKFLEHLKRIGKVPTYYQSNGHPRFKKKNKSTPSFYQDTFKIQFTSTHVKIEGFANSKKKNKQKVNWIRLAEHNRVPINAKYYNPRITFDGLNWWISVGAEVEENPKMSLNDKGLGIDLGIKDFAITSDNEIFKNINKSRTIRQLEKRKRRIQKQVSKKYLINKKGDSYCKTKNIIKQEKTLLKLNHRLTNIRTNYLNQTINTVINRKPRFICIEDLNIKGMMSNKHLSKAVQNQKLYEFRTKLTYKCDINQIPLVIADRFYPSSKTCSCCGSIKKDLKLFDRTYICNTCELIIDRDYNASLNLLKYGENQITQQIM